MADFGNNDPSNQNNNSYSNTNTPKNSNTVSTPGFWTEMGYLFDKSIQNSIDNNDNTNSIDNRINSKLASSGYTVIFKDKAARNTTELISHYKNKVNATDGMNPYSKLIHDFKNIPSCALKPSDFAYLTDLGVYPLNRLWILRRFLENDSVPDNLNDWGGPKSITKGHPKPVSTVVGWIKHDEKDLLSVNFSEKWTTTNEMLHTLLLKITEKEFGQKFDSLSPAPGWSRGIMFQFLSDMGLVGKEWGTDSIPLGDPNILREGATRSNTADVEFGLNSGVKFTLKTSYEMKFIGDVDPGSAMMDIIENLFYIGTSNTKFIMNPNGSSLDAFKNAVNTPNDPHVWLTLVKTILDKFLGAIAKVFNQAKDYLSNLGNSTTTKTTKDSGPSNASGTTLASVTNAFTKTGVLQSNGNGGLQINSTLVDSMFNILGTILASTVAIYRWPLKGSLALMTGLSSTPWHLTIGNPYSPTISLSNVIVTDVKLSLPNEFGYNDMPSRIDVEISVSQGRNMGAQELFRMFNNSYQRVYSPSVNNGSFLFRRNQ